jgi:hypothetical protein
MTATAFSRRGFLARAAAGVVGLLGGSFVGGLSTRAWAHPLRRLRGGERPVIGQPRSVVPIGLDEALRREQLASQRHEVRSLVSDLIGSGYKRSGQPGGVDGVAGWPTEGGRAVSLGFAKDDSDEATVFVVARWWDEKRREAWPCEDVMPDVFSKEVIRGAPGTPSSVIRFRYFDEQGDLVSREETLDVSSVVNCTEMDCHTHPLGPCPESCDTGPAACVHCDYWENVCSHPAPDCPECKLCYLCALVPGCAFCGLTCEAVCNGFAEKYCCDERQFVCCPFDWSLTMPPQLPDCL